MVLLDGDWYHVDCTHDDLDNDEEQVQYRFFLVSDEYFGWKIDGSISYNRSWVKEVQRNPFTEKSYTYPVASSTKYQPAVDFIRYYDTN